LIEARHTQPQDELDKTTHGTAGAGSRRD
jgi:hypothetical protein